MKRVIAVAMCSTLIAGCSDRVTAPSRLQAGGNPLELGFPPPPPATGSDGFADFSANSDISTASVTNALLVDGAAQPTASCGLQSVALSTFDFSYKYFENGPHSNEFLHIFPADPNGKQIDLSRHGTTFDAHGVLSGSEGGVAWTFTITGALPTSHFLVESNPQGDNNNPLVPGFFQYDVTGRIDTAQGSCDAMGKLIGTLNGGFIPETVPQ
jgi:hypothetical protein